MYVSDERSLYSRRESFRWGLGILGALLPLSASAASSIETVMSNLTRERPFGHGVVVDEVRPLSDGSRFVSYHDHFSLDDPKVIIGFKVNVREHPRHEPILYSVSAFVDPFVLVDIVRDFRGQYIGMNVDVVQMRSKPYHPVNQHRGHDTLFASDSSHPDTWNLVSAPAQLLFNDVVDFLATLYSGSPSIESLIPILDKESELLRIMEPLIRKHHFDGPRALAYTHFSNSPRIS